MNEQKGKWTVQDRKLIIEKDFSMKEKAHRHILLYNMHIYCSVSLLNCLWHVPDQVEFSIALLRASC